MELNLLPFVVEALGYNKAVYPDIDRVYQAHKYEFYKAATEHELYTHQIVTEGGLLQEEYCKKALGILLCLDEETSRGLSDIYRKGWTYAYLFVENHQEVDLQKFIQNAVRKAGGLDRVSDDWLNTQIFIAYFLALNAKKPIIENAALTELQKMLVARWQHYSEGDETRISLKHASQEELTKVNALKNQIYQWFGIVKDMDSLINVFDKKTELPAFLFDFEKLSIISVIDSISFGEKDIEEILLAYTVAREKPYSLDDAAQCLMFAMYIKYMAKAYKQVKEHYFRHNRETMYVEVEGLEKRLSALSQENTRLSHDLSEVRKVLDILEKENQRLKRELDVERRNRQELNGLREFLFTLDKQEEYAPTDEANLDELKGFRAVLIGGHEKWQARMKEFLPGFTFIRPDNKAFDLRLLEGLEAVFIYTNYLNHAIYERTMRALEGTNTQISYINQKNEKLVLQDIWEVYRDISRQRG